MQKKEAWVRLTVYTDFTLRVLKLRVTAFKLRTCDQLAGFSNVASNPVGWTFRNGWVRNL